VDDLTAIGIVAIAAALAIGLPALATAWAQSKIGSAGAGALAEKPELAGTVIILIAIPETMVVLGFVIGFLITGLADTIKEMV
jgi:V/A-type H+-transporting ATPase subunit K